MLWYMVQVLYSWLMLWFMIDACYSSHVGTQLMHGMVQEHRLDKYKLTGYRLMCEWQ
jgi:hypothetical protein